MPLYALGLMGMTRACSITTFASWQPWLVVAAVGVVVILAGIVCQVVQLVVLDPRSRTTEGDRGSMERPHAGMGDGFAAASLEFRHAAASPQTSTPSGKESSASALNKLSRRRSTNSSLSRCREQRDRLRHGVLFKSLPALR